MELREAIFVLEAAGVPFETICLGEIVDEDFPEDDDGNKNARSMYAVAFTHPETGEWAFAEQEFEYGPHRSEILVRLIKKSDLKNHKLRDFE